MNEQEPEQPFDDFDKVLDYLLESSPINPYRVPLATLLWALRKAPDDVKDVIRRIVWPEPSEDES